MRTTKLSLSFALLLAVAGCGDDTAAGVDMAPDLSVSLKDMALPSQCGHPGDTGNSKGVGLYCTLADDNCKPPASLCSALGNGSTPSSSDTYFCTMVCAPGATDCGAGASCACQSSQCACVPNSCLGVNDM